FCFILIGEKRLRQPDPRDPDLTCRIGKSAQAPLRMWRKEWWRKWATWAPHQVMFWLWKGKRWNQFQAPAPL
ncbi:hypothetical protein AB205_0133090, partial [Aquarana catesbeiana]